MSILPPARRGWAAVLAVVLASAALGAQVPDRADAAASPQALDGRSGPLPPLSSAGRWLTDRDGRVVILHGVNRVAKAAPFHPAAFGFGPDDLRFLSEHGLDVLRLGVDFRGLMPEPGVVDDAYIRALAETVRAAAQARVFVLLDFHQDGYGPLVHGNGFPEWMTITDGLPNPNVGFPEYYLLNPALQRAFENFWANRAGPGGIGLQDYFLQGLEAVASRFARERWVVGYELMNEPWPGADWTSCIDGTGCPEHETALLRPFYERATRLLERVAPEQFAVMEPFVLFNFGQGPTTVPGVTGARTALSTHSYAADVAGEEGVVRFTNAASESQQVPATITEFGASNDPALLTRLTSQFDRGRLSWFYWEYAENIIRDEFRTAGPDNLRSPAAFAALVRPYPVATAGTPLRWTFDPATKAFDFEYSTTRPDGASSHRDLETLVSVPTLQYPNGYTVTVTGARVVSRPCSPTLVLRAGDGARAVAARVTPGGRCPP